MAANAQHLSKDVEWGTHPILVKPCREALGGVIHLDPASSPLANQVIRAKKIFTEDDNGLEKDWNLHGVSGVSVFLNPPYCRTRSRWGRTVSATGIWVTRAVQAFIDGEVKRIILVTKSVDATKWGRVLSGFPRCKLAERADFYSLTDVASRSELFDSFPESIPIKRVPHETQITFMGPCEEHARFKRLFEPLGRVSF